MRREAKRPRVRSFLIWGYAALLGIAGVLAIGEGINLEWLAVVATTFLALTLVALLVRFGVPPVSRWVWQRFARLSDAREESKKMDVRSVRLHLIGEPLALVVVGALLGVVLANFILLVIGGVLAMGTGGAWAYIWVFARDRLEELGFHW